ncbi:hypothetical protein GCM10010168_26470 [Actinoplanes ianthinogenes]|uniref:SnoaL-like domain-containing protein n=1 Tax=Actinoplanes ianthinogenes TaxID=122358 RepID=A0ABN6CUY9_9ACTN|nr:nuclear transport factor 2 family protein [Actinoplanes ianthinogenes]BCJ48287.1 hypothetical protein Aiant_89440 [Actinoplanes ianthinogenes]GGR07712.1 hypothetical protein GCM10010168_26470 [Actinoplanes ianthinogenes]
MTDFPGTDLAAHLAAYTAAFATGSSAALDDFYEPDAIVVPQPGTPRAGAAQRQATLQHLLDFGLPMRAQLRHHYTTGDLALTVVEWSIRGTARQGFPLDVHGVAADVLRRGPDGRWRYLIDNPFGTAAGQDPQPR